MAGDASAPSEATTQETPNDKKIGNTQSHSHLVHVRLGKRERSILLGLNGDAWAWTQFPEWNDPKSKTTFSRAINKLIRLELIESDYDRVWGSRHATRRDKNGIEQNYNIYFDRTRKLSLTRCGEAVVNQFHDELISGKRIRWSRFVMPEPEDLAPWIITSYVRNERYIKIPLPAAVNDDVQAALAYARRVLDSMACEVQSLPPRPDTRSERAATAEAIADAIQKWDRQTTGRADGRTLDGVNARRAHRSSES
jgi:hypothetical protein